MTHHLSRWLGVALLSSLACGACKAKPKPQAPPVSPASSVVADSAEVAPDLGSVEAETLEPRLGFRVRVGADWLNLTEGTEAIAKGSFKDPSISIQIRPERTFPYAGLEFAYPRHFTFEAKLAGDSSDSWVLLGNDFKIMVTRFKVEVSLDAFADQMVKQFGASASSSPLTTTLAGKDYETRRIRALMAHQVLLQDVVRLPSSHGQTRYFVLQDLNSQDKPESVAARALLTRTLRVSE